MKEILHRAVGMKLVTTFITGLGLFSGIAHAQTITLRSGNGAVGSADSDITFFSSGDGAIGPFTAGDFAAATAGSHATVVNAYPAWVASLSADPLAKWIAVNASDSPKSALYAYTFDVTSPSIASASITLNYAVDNNLGQSSVPGLYLNGTALPTTSGLGGFGHQYTYTDNNIASLLQPGTNTLYFYQYDYGGVAGSIFSATIDVTPRPVPVPAAAWLLLSGVGGLGILARRERRT